MLYIPSWLQQRIIMLEDVDKSLTERAVWEELSSFGAVDRVQFFRDGGREHVFVTFLKADGAQRALAGHSRLRISSLNRRLLGKYDAPSRYLPELHDTLPGRSRLRREAPSELHEREIRPARQPQRQHSTPPNPTTPSPSINLSSARAEVSATLPAIGTDTNLPSPKRVDLLHRLQPPDTIPSAADAGVGTPTSQSAVSHLIDRIHGSPNPPSLLQRVHGDIHSASPAGTASIQESALSARLSPMKPSILQRVEGAQLHRTASLSSLVTSRSDGEISVNLMESEPLEQRYEDSRNHLVRIQEGLARIQTDHKSIGVHHNQSLQEEERSRVSDPEMHSPTIMFLKERLALSEKMLEEERERSKQVEEDLRRQLDDKEQVIVNLRSQISHIFTEAVGVQVSSTPADAFTLHRYSNEVKPVGDTSMEGVEMTPLHPMDEVSAQYPRSQRFIPQSQIITVGPALFEAFRRLDQIVGMVSSSGPDPENSEPVRKKRKLDES